MKWHDTAIVRAKGGLKDLVGSKTDHPGQGGALLLHHHPHLHTASWRKLASTATVQLESGEDNVKGWPSQKRFGN